MVRVCLWAARGARGRNLHPDTRHTCAEPVVGWVSTRGSSLHTGFNGAGGRERTQAEFEKLLERAGLKVRKNFPTESALYILEATRA
jgi:hypothetical protein